MRRDANARRRRANPAVRRLAPLLILLVWPTSLAAQMVRLPPPTMTASGRGGIEAVSYDTPLLAETASVTPEPAMPPGTRPGMFQKLILDGTWLMPSGGDDFGVSSLEAKAVFALPCPARTSPLLITPGFAVHYLDGPTTPDLPPRLYDATTQFRWLAELSPRWAVDLMVKPGIYSDFEQGTDDAFRITGYGVAVLTCNPRFKLALGAAYLDQADLSVVPAVGIIWTPRDDLKFELIMPRPRIAARIDRPGAWAKDVETWVYIAGELGGGTWAIERAAGATDELRYTDYRVLLGLQRKRPYGLDTRLEVGYVFGREVEFGSGQGDFDPDGTLLLRGGVTY